VVPISKASASQRTGRAGRVKNGKCYRLYTQKSFESLEEKTESEIERCNLAFTFLQLKALGIEDLLGFHYLTPPSQNSTIKALETLYLLGALNQEGKLTSPLGNNMAELPCDNPFLSKMLLNSIDLGCTKEIVTIASMLSTPNIFISSKGAKIVTDKSRSYFSVVEGDHFTLLNIYNSFIHNKKSKTWCNSLHLNYRALVQASFVRKQYLSYLKKFSTSSSSNATSSVSSTEDLALISKCIISGYFPNAAVLQKDGSSYETIRGNFTVHVHPNSVYFKCSVMPKYVIFYDILHTTQPYMNNIIEINPDYLSPYYNVK
jgi:ATP-dependent RNA helicase DDX35